MTVSSVTLNGSMFPVLSMCDASMTKEAQKKYGIIVDTRRIETHIPVFEDSIFTSDVVMAAFFSIDTFDVTGNICAPVCLIEKKIGATKLLEAYSYDEHNGYSKEAKFMFMLDGFLGCTSFLNLGFYLLKVIAGIETRSIYTIYFVDKNYLDNDKDDDESCDTGLEAFLQQKNKSDL